MSVDLMGKIWGQSIAPSGRKLVLLAFADAANDDGVTWIALHSDRGKLDMQQKCSMSERALRDHVAALIADGWIERYETPGKGSLWRVHATPAISAPVTPADFALTPAEIAGGAAENAPEPLSNRQLEEKGRERVKPVSDRCPIAKRPLPAGVSLDQWEAFVDMRVSIGKPMGAYVASKVLEALDKLGRQGWHAGDVLDRSTVNVWADVYEPEAGRVTGVRRVVAGAVAEPVGMSDADRAEMARIAQLPVGEMLAARRDFMAQLERRNAPSPLREMVGELPLRPPVMQQRNG